MNTVPRPAPPETQDRPSVPVYPVGDVLTAKSFFQTMGEGDYLIRYIDADPDRIARAVETGTDRDPESDTWAHYPGQHEELLELGITSPDQYTFVTPYSSTPKEFRTGKRGPEDIPVGSGTAVLVYDPTALIKMPSHHRSETGGRHRFDPTRPDRGLLAVFVYDEQTQQTQVAEANKLSARAVRAAARVLRLARR